MDVRLKIANLWAVTGHNSRCKKCLSLTGCLELQVSINVSLQIGLIRFIASSGKEPVLSFVLEVWET